MLEGLPPHDAATLLRLVCDEADARRAADAVVELFDPAATAAAAFENEASTARPKSWTLEVYLAPRVATEAVRTLLATILGVTHAAIALERLDEQDWVGKSLEGLRPVRAGRFLVHGQHDRIHVKPNDMALEIEAALAFGTGHHGTTRGCLLVLDELLKRRRPRRVLDLGTGTGVLAMAIARALKRPVASGDLDPVAVATATANAAANGLARWVRPVVAPGLRHERLRRGAPYDLIVANILARPLRGLAPALATHAAPGAALILSGLLAADVPGILSAYGPQGFRLQRRRDLDGWATLSFTKA